MARNGTQTTAIRRKGDDTFILAMASGATVDEAAKQAGISARTAWRRLQEPALRQEIGNTRTMLVSQAVGMLADAATDAAATLRTLLAAESDSVKLSAARAILEAGLRLRESDELAQRIAALEAAVPTEPEVQRWRA